MHEMELRIRAGGRMTSGFTLIEVLVATLLLSMLVTILTMIFNQSSIAWTTGVASVTALGDMRQDMAQYAADAENAVRSDGNASQVLRITSVFNENGQGLRTEGRTLSQTFEQTMPQRDAMADPLTFSGGKNEFSLSGSGAKGHDSYIVGVHSDGPDGKTGGDYSWDDIDTLPEEVVK